MKIFLNYLFVLVPFVGVCQSFFTQPVSDFIQKPSEVIIDLSFSNASIGTIQSTLNNTRLSNDSAAIRVTLLGTFTVTNSPLVIPSRTQLVLKNANIQASTSATSTSLIKVENAQNVTIAGLKSSVLNGVSKNMKGIEIMNSGKVHMDNLTIQNCNLGGIHYSGRGSASYADPGSTTRCIIKNCESFGIKIANCFQFICTDNTIQYCTDGISLNANNSLIANNVIKNCSTAIYDFSKYEAIAYNTIQDCSVGIRMSSTSQETVISHNTITKNSTGLQLNGSKSRVYYNDCNNTTEVVGIGSGNHLYANKGITSQEGDIVGCIYFNPPLIDNQHNETISIGKTRKEITITNGSMSRIRTRLDSMHRSNPNAVIVVKLNGTFYTSGTSDSLVVKDDECFLLTGSIIGTGSSACMVYFNGVNASFSGGTIDGKNVNGSNSLICTWGASNVILDKVNILNSAGMGLSKRGNNGTPVYMRACTISNNPNGRGVHVLGSSRLIAFENDVSKTRYDGFDFDAYSTYCVAMKNTCSYNQRASFFIEEGANNHIVAGNDNFGNTGKNYGIAFFNLEVWGKYTSKNLIVSNVCKSNWRGMNISANSSQQATTENVIFNNIFENNESFGIGGYINTKVTYNNYNAFNTIRNNGAGSFSPYMDYNTNTVWNLLPCSKPRIETYSLLTSFCQGGSLLLKASLGSSYNWLNGNSKIGSTQNYLATISGQYRVALTTSSGCSDTSEIVTITVNPKPIVKITSPANNATLTTDIFPINTTVTGTNMSNVSFYNGSSLLGADASSPYSFTTPSMANGTYTLSAIARNTFNCTDTAKVTVRVNKVVTDLEASNDLSASIHSYPNPFQESMKIVASGSFSYIFYNTAGLEVEKGAGNGNIIVGELLPEGLYILQVKSDTIEKTLKVNKRR